MSHLPRVKLVEHSADVDARGNRDGRTPYEAALLAGNPDIAEYVAAHGARRSPLQPAEAFAVTCVAGRREKARAMLARYLQLLDQLDGRTRMNLVHRAVASGRRRGRAPAGRAGFRWTP